MVLPHEVGSASHQSFTNHHIEHYFSVRNGFSLIKTSNANFYQLILISILEKLRNHQKLKPFPLALVALVVYMRTCVREKGEPAHSHVHAPPPPPHTRGGGYWCDGCPWDVILGLHSRSILSYAEAKAARIDRKMQYRDGGRVHAQASALSRELTEARVQLGILADQALPDSQFSNVQRTGRHTPVGSRSSTPSRLREPRRLPEGSLQTDGAYTSYVTFARGRDAAARGPRAGRRSASTDSRGSRGSRGSRASSMDRPAWH